jgi:hypothetical protein
MRRFSDDIQRVSVELLPEPQNATPQQRAIAVSLALATNKLGGAASQMVAFAATVNSRSRASAGEVDFVPRRVLR